MRYLIFVLALAILAPASAQQLEPDFMRRALDAVTIQRNNAENNAAAQQVRADIAEEKLAAVQKQLDKAKARVEELEKATP